MKATTQAWVEGIATAFITTFSNAAIGVLALPTVFNGTRAGLYNIAKMTLIPSAISVFTVLRQSPLPSKTETTTLTLTKEQTPAK